MMPQSISAAEFRAQLAKKSAGKRHKFNARPVKKGERADGLTFPTQLEAARYDTLRMMERAGEIAPGSIRLQVRFQLTVKAESGELVHVCTYVADFVYRLTRAPNVDVVEDAKGVRTDVFKIKKALMRACLGIEVQEVGEERKPRRRRRPPKTTR